MSSLFDLNGKTALVAGGGGYLGTPVCEALAAHGARVLVADLRLDAAQASAERARRSGSAEAVALDTADEHAIERVCDEAGPLEILVNLAASSRGRSLDEASAEDWAAGLEVCLTGSFLLARAAAKQMGEQGGSIIHFSSMYGMISPDPRLYENLLPPNPPDYGAAKAGILQLTRYQAVFWARRNIRVNTIVPGPFPKPHGQGGVSAFTDRLSDRVPMGRVGNAEEIAGAVVYLASNASSYVTGTSLVVDGGWTAW